MSEDINIKNIGGEELLNLIINGELNPPNMAQTISMELKYASNGKARFIAYPKEKHLNPLGGVHGGFSATVLDSVTGCAVHTLLGPGELYATTDLNVKMVKPIQVDQILDAIGEVISISKRLALAHGTIKDKKGTIYAYATATCMIKRN